RHARPLRIVSTPRSNWERYSGEVERFFNSMRSSKGRTGKPSRVKVNGIHYTPPELAGFLADVTVQALGEREGPVQVLDPACGDGGLLMAFTKAVPVGLRS